MRATGFVPSSCAQWGRSKKTRAVAACIALFAVGLTVSSALGAAGPLSITTTSESTTSAPADTSPTDTATTSACASAGEQISADYTDGNISVNGSGFPNLCDLNVQTFGPTGLADSGATSTS